MADKEKTTEEGIRDALESQLSMLNRVALVKSIVEDMIVECNTQRERLEKERDKTPAPFD